MRYLALTFAIVMSVALASVPVPASAAQIRIVAAENFYGTVAAAIGGAHVKVTSILSNPNQDPHLFEATPSTARAMANAEIVIQNGLGYDPWVHDLLRASKIPGRTVLTVAQLIGAKNGENPHIWYLPRAVTVLAHALALDLMRRDPPHRADYERNRQAFDATLMPLQRKIAEMRAKYHGTTVTATEPVFNYMAAALGLVMRNERFQLSVMNDTEPRASDIAAFENDLRSRRVKALIFNAQTTGVLTRRLQDLARQSHVPVVGVTETEPLDTTYREWMMATLSALDHALAGGTQ